MKKVNETTAIIGLGYVGLPLMLDFCEADLKVNGLNNDNNEFKSLISGEIYISYI